MFARKFISASLCFLALPLPALASNAAVDPTIATDGAIAPGAVPQNDLTARRWNVQPSIGYFSGTPTFDGSGASVSAQGWGGTGEAEYSLSDHVGLSFSALGYQGRGTYTPGSSEIGASSGSASVSGWALGVTLVLDPFRGTDFRMPFFFGLDYEHLSSATPTSPTVTSLTLNSPGYTLGFSPRFNLAFLRLEPFFIVTTPMEKGNVGCAADVIEGTCGAADVQVLPVVGMNIIFTPWNLSFYLNLSNVLLGTGVSFYSLGHQFSF